MVGYIYLMILFYGVEYEFCRKTVSYYEMLTSHLLNEMGSGWFN